LKNYPEKKVLARVEYLSEVYLSLTHNNQDKIILCLFHNSTTGFTRFNLLHLKVRFPEDICIFSKNYFSS